MNKTFTSMNHFFSEDEAGKRQCPVCGKMFNPAPEHAYYIGNNKRDLCCSYTCMRNNEKYKTVMNVSRKRKHGTCVRVAETDEIFESISDCARHLRVSYPLVYRALMSGCTCKGYHIEAMEVGDAE